MLPVQRDARGGRVLVVDDDAQVRKVVLWQLEAEGFAVVEAPDGERALSEIDRHAPDIVVLDLSLPRIGGLDVLARVQRTSTIPVIVLTGRDGETDRIVGLDLGADDYLVKPFSPRELAARVRSVLRRTTTTAAIPAQRTYGRLAIDVAVHEVTLDGVPVELTAKEFDLLAFLAGAPRQVFSRAQLLSQVWSSSPDWQDEGTVTQHVHRLRHKVEDDPNHPRWLRTVRGIGYRFEP